MHSIKTSENLLFDDCKLCRLHAHSAWSSDLCLCMVRLRMLINPLANAAEILLIGENGPCVLLLRALC